MARTVNVTGHTRSDTISEKVSVTGQTQSDTVLRKVNVRGQISRVSAARMPQPSPHGRVYGDPAFCPLTVARAQHLKREKCDKEWGLLRSPFTDRAATGRVQILPCYDRPVTKTKAPRHPGRWLTASFAANSKNTVPVVRSSHFTTFSRCKIPESLRVEPISRADHSVPITT